MRCGKATFGVFILEAFDHAREGGVKELETSCGVALVNVGLEDRVKDWKAYCNSCRRRFGLL